MAVIDLFTGLLGAGKTTLIRQYCQYLSKQGKNFVIIENEFGSAGVDSALLSSCGVRVKELSGGCICCTMKAGFAQMLLDLAEQTDHIIVEPSGVFTLGDFFEVIKAPSLQFDCSIGIVATVLDASILSSLTEDDKALLTAQLCGTGSIIVNRCNSEALHKTVFKMIRSQTKSPLFLTDSMLGNIDFNSLYACKPSFVKAICADINHSYVYQSTTIFPKQNYTSEQAYLIATTACSGKYGDVLRIKGQLNTKGDSMIFLNATKSGIHTEELEQKGSGMINVIGRRLQRNNLKKLFE